MTTRGLSSAGIVLAFLLLACSPQATGSASPTPTGPGLPTPPVTASIAAAPSPTGTAAPTATPVPAPTPVPASAAVTWTRIAWRKLPAEEPLAQIRTVTTWRGGYVGRGDPVTIDGTPPANGDTGVHTPMWTSPDGLSWKALDADVLGGAGVVVGMAPTPGGVVALTVTVGPTIRDEETGDTSWKVTGPVQTWTSPDGRTWTPAPGPDIGEPGTVTGSGDWLAASTTPLLIVTRSRPSFVSTNGVDWSPVTTTGLPKAFPLAGLSPIGSGFLVFRDDAIASSPDARTWTTQTLPAPCSANEGIVIGRDGLIARGITDTGGHVAPWVWCVSTNVHTWHKLAGLKPLGLMKDEAAQECRDNCPDGTLVGDGLRMIAYRGWGDDQVGWTSFDGRTWQPLMFDGRPERSSGWLDDKCTNTLEVLPMGLRCTATDGAVWFGDPSS
jgi:hypothetical protein